MQACEGPVVLIFGPRNTDGVRAPAAAQVLARVGRGLCPVTLPDHHAPTSVGNAHIAGAAARFLVTAARGRGAGADA